MKKSNNILAAILILGVLVLVLTLTGAPGLRRNPPHDEASVAAMPYTLAGENEYWRAEYRLEPAAEEVQAQVDVELAYQAVFTLTYLGSPADLSGATGYTVAFAGGTDYKAGGKQRGADAAALAGVFSGETPLWTLYYPADTSVAGAIPPVDGTYEVSVKIAGRKDLSGTLFLTKEDAS